MEKKTTTETWPTTPDVNLMLETQYRVYDGLLAVGFCLCFIIGFPGNCLALKFFVKSGKRNLPTLIYMTASSIDIISSVIHLPLIFNLLNERDPGLLGQEMFCYVWYFLMLNLQLISMFVVMLLSVIRAIAIMCPFYKVKKKAVLISIPAALIYFCSWNSAIAAIGDSFYSHGFGYCHISVSDIRHTQFDIAYMLNYTLCTALPPLVVLSSMIVATFKLKRKSMASESRHKNRRASKTIIYFAVIFLACNFLTFLNNSLFTYSKISSHGYLYFYGNNTFLFFYSWLISEIFCTVLNAALNPILYMCRMKEMRVWVWSLLRVSQAAPEESNEHL